MYAKADVDVHLVCEFCREPLQEAKSSIPFQSRGAIQHPLESGEEIQHQSGEALENDKELNPWRSVAEYRSAARACRGIKDAFRKLSGKQDPPKEVEVPHGGARACYLNIYCEPGQTSAILSELKTIAKAQKIQQPAVLIPGDNVVNAKFVHWRERDKFEGFLESAFKVSWLAFSSS